MNFFSSFLLKIFRAYSDRIKICESEAMKGIKDLCKVYI